MESSPISLFERLTWLRRGLLLLLFLGALILRLYRLDELPLDFHPARQLQSMIKARGMYLQSLPSPQMDWKREAALDAWKASPTQEPEIVEGLAVWMYRLAGQEDLRLPRVASILFWLAGGLALYGLARDVLHTPGALTAVAFYLYLPYGVWASRAFMPDPLNTALIISAVWAFNRWISRSGWAMAIMAGLLGGLAILVKITAVFWIAGGFAGLLLVERGLPRALRSLQVWVIAALCVLPAVAYHLLGMVVLGFITPNLLRLRIFPGMIFQPATWIRVDNKIVQVVGGLTFILSLAGAFFLKGKRERGLVWGLWAGYALYGLVFIYYYASHDYYQLPLLALAGLGVGALVDALAARLTQLSGARVATAVFLGGLMLSVGQWGWSAYSVLDKLDFSDQPAFWQKLGEELRGHSSIALTQDYNGRLSYWGSVNVPYFLSFSDFAQRELAGDKTDIAAYFKEQTQGKEYFLITMLADLDHLPALKEILFRDYPVVDQGPGYLLFKLQ